MDRDEGFLCRIFAAAIAPLSDALADFRERLTALFPELPEKALCELEAVVRGDWELH